MKFKFYNMAHTHYNILIIIIRGIFGIHKTSKIELFAKVVTSFKTSNSFAKISILEVCLVFQFTSDYFVNTSDRFIYLRRRQLIDNNCSPLPRDINHFFSIKLFVLLKNISARTFCLVETKVFV